jgi:CxxC motif-containing protein (DUF1111 family)
LKTLTGALLSVGLGGAAAALAAGAGPAVSLRAELLAAPLDARLGGATTVPSQAEDAYTFIAANASDDERRLFAFGNRLFNTEWAAFPGPLPSFDGLGPTFNRAACSDCHVRGGRGAPPAQPGDPMESMLVRLSVPGGQPHPRYGDQLQDRAIEGVPAEGRAILHYESLPGTYGDGTPYGLLRPRVSFTDLAFGALDDAAVSPRVAPAMIGLGLLEAVPLAALEALADPDDVDGDGISGRINWLLAPDGPPLAGRFGWKANVASLADQSAAAAAGDLGITSRLAPRQNCPMVQAACGAVVQDAEPEMSDSFLDRLVAYVRLLAVPAARDLDTPLVRRGEGAFRSFGCAACHVPTLTTAADAPLAAVAGQRFHPFTDLLVHDMGEGLADHRPDGSASGTEWRTPPLWGLGLLERVNGHMRLLHDGRARGLAEAILWHGGEGEAAKEAFRRAPAAERQALIAFLSAL